jgi:serine/threonine-protein phosphatase 4 regulatory subunit 1
MDLVEFFFGMNDQVRIQQVDSELPFLCAYSFPGVALTLGPGYWTLMKPLFESLSQHMHWKIRRALSFSLHDLAHLIGPEKAVTDILPVFEDFLKDVEDVSVCQLVSISCSLF